MTGDSVLIVDDNALNLRLMEVLLRKEGYVIRTAVSASEAVEMLRDFRPRLILMDLQMPGMDGIEATRRLKADPVTADIPVLAVTAYAMKGDDRKALEAGCWGYVTKPIDTRQFPRIVANAIASAWPAEQGSS